MKRVGTIEMSPTYTPMPFMTQDDAIARAEAFQLRRLLPTERARKQRARPALSLSLESLGRFRSR
jgi:hypothetical protein